MNHLCVLLGIISGLIIGGSIFGISLMYQALNILDINELKEFKNFIDETINELRNN